jgi:photosystem II stability/assembly factor-like uncharacterized protein
MGQHFAPLGTGLPTGAVRALVLSSFYPLDPVLFTVVGDRGVFRSTDQGKTWQGSGLEGHVLSDLAWVGTQLFAVDTSRLWLSENAGRSWTPVERGIEAKRLLRIVFPLAPELGLEAFLCTNDGLLHSVDGGLTWTPGGLAGEQVLCLGTFPPIPSPARR